MSFPYRFGNWGVRPVAAVSYKLYFQRVLLCSGRLRRFRWRIWRGGCIGVALSVRLREEDALVGDEFPGGHTAHLKVSNSGTCPNIAHNQRMHISAHIAIRLFQPLIESLFAQSRVPPMQRIHTHEAKLQTNFYRLCPSIQKAAFPNRYSIKPA